MIGDDELDVELLRTHRVLELAVQALIAQLGLLAVVAGAIRLGIGS